MSYLLNDPSTFAEEAAAGFVLANRATVRAVPGGVARAVAPRTDRVRVVVGGGSGHYPAFAGLVGPGLADAAAMGNVFASPSAQQVHSVATSVAGPGGVLLSYGNYAGDVLNFDQAQARLREEGIACQTVTVTDDIASAPVAQRERRRGIAGDLVVFKAAAWAAAEGRDLDAVAEVARHANDRTVSLGVAFAGSTLPGAEDPLFTVPTGTMEIGMGIHGEPGLGEEPMASADELAELLVRRLLAERPQDTVGASSSPVAVMVNGLGAVKSEELYVLYGCVAPRLEAAGLRVVDPEVGEFATSFEMAGVSLTLCWLDDVLEQAWRAPAHAPGYRKGDLPRTTRPPATTAIAEVATTSEPVVEHDSTPSDESSRRVAATIARALAAVRVTIDEHADELGRLDAVAGDGDHGIGMQRGARAADETARTSSSRGDGASTVLRNCGDAWADRAGGTSGALWGVLLRAFAGHFDDQGAPDDAHVVKGVADAVSAVMDAGKATVGDKSMVDALVPFRDTLTRGVGTGDSLPVAWAAAAGAATDAALATADLSPHVGRARPHATRSIGTPDPGAVSFALAMTAAATALRQEGDVR